MKAYGHSRKDMQRCRYGCCGFNSVKQKDCRDVVDKSKRKSARQEGQNEVKSGVDSFLHLE